MSEHPTQPRRPTSVKIVQFEPVNLRIALDHAAAGFPVFPAKLVPGENGRWSKTPCIEHWNNKASTDEDQIRAWWRNWPDAAAGIPIGICHLIALDSDRHGGPDGVTALEHLIAQHEPPASASNNAHGRERRAPHLQTAKRPEARQPYRLVAGGHRRARCRRLDRGARHSATRWQPLGARGQHADADEAVQTNTIPELPRWLVNIIARRAAEQTGVRPPTEQEQEFAARSLKRYAEELVGIEPGEGRNNKLNTIAYTMGRMGGPGWIGEDEVEAALITACDKNGLSSDKDSHGLRGVRATFRSGWNAGFAKPREPLIPAPFNSEEFPALEYVERYGDDLRYVAKWNRWMAWDGKRWVEDDRRTSFRYAREICRDAALKLDRGGGRLASAKTRAAIVSLAQDDAKIAATIKQWDTGSWLLNTPDGTVDLRTGEMREHRREDYITKVTAVTPDKRADSAVAEIPRRDLRR
jgi:hypothetical protein